MLEGDHFDFLVLVVLVRRENRFALVLRADSERFDTLAESARATRLNRSFDTSLGDIIRRSSAGASG